MSKSASGSSGGGQQSGVAQASDGGKQFDSFSSPVGTNGKLTAFKKIGFSARRALMLVSRSIENRGGARSGSDGDASSGSQALEDSSSHAPTRALAHHLSTQSINLNRSSTCESLDLSGLSDCPSAASTQPPQPQPQLSAVQPPPPPCAPPTAAVPSKPRSLLSALLKRPTTATTTTASSTADSTSSSKPTAAAPAPAPTPPAPTQPSPISCPPRPPTPGSPHPLCCSASPPSAPQPPCSLDRLYESMPAQQARRTPHVPTQSLLVPVPARPSRGGGGGAAAAPDRVGMYLSAPSPHMASLRQAVMEMEPSEGQAGAGPRPGPRPTPEGASSAPKAKAAAAMAAGLTSATAARACCPGSRPAAVPTSFQASPMPLPLAPRGVDEAAPAPPAGIGSAASSLPAASLLASSPFGSGGGAGLRGCRRLPGAVGAAEAEAAAAAAAADAAAAAAAAATEAAMAAGQSVLLAVGSATPPSMLRSNWCLEDYSLQKRLYKGKMASVYKGRCLRSGLPVALKVYFKSRVPANVVHMVMREVGIHMAASEHRAVLKLYGVFQNEEVAVLVMELASRGSLAGICRSLPGGRLNETQVRQTVLDPMLDALSYLHGKGVCHRDIKPENLLFTSDWGFRLADFGVSINLTEERAVTRAGTADYMAPEVERCPLKVHPDENKEDDSLAYGTAADVWSVGVLAYELLVGFPPMVGGCGGLSFPASVSAGARDFITAALAALPEERPTVRQLRCHPWMVMMAAAGAAAAAGGGGGGGGGGCYDSCRRRDIEL